MRGSLADVLVRDCPETSVYLPRACSWLDLAVNAFSACHDSGRQTRDPALPKIGAN